jgi:hypothetical protein
MMNLLQHLKINPYNNNNSSFLVSDKESSIEALPLLIKYKIDVEPLGLHSQSPDWERETRINNFTHT